MPNTNNGPGANGQKNENHKLKEQIQNILGGLGLGGDFSFLIDQAVRNQFTTTDFLVRLVHTGTFRRAYPGLIAHGNIAAFLSDNPSAFSAENLGAAIRKYNSLTNAYTQVLRGYDIELTPNKIAMLIKGQQSPEEFAVRINAINAIKANPGLGDLFNAELKAAGKPGLDEIGLFKFAARTAPKDFYDIYEAATLRNQGLNIGSQDALSVAQQLGTPGQLTDLTQIVAAVKALGPDVGPELAQAGISDADLVLLQAGNDPKGIAPQLQTIVNNRRAKGTYVPGSQSRAGQGGGPAIYQPEDSAAY